MNRKVIKYILELFYIFIIPLLFIVATSEIDISKEYIYDNDGNFDVSAETKKLTFNNSIIKYTYDPLYTNYLNFNQLANWKYTINTDDSVPMVLYIDNSGSRKNHKFYIKSNFNDIQIWGSDDQFQEYWSGLPTTRDFYTTTNAISTLPYNNMFIRNYPTNNYLTNYGEIELYIEVFDLTQIYGIGYEPSTIQEFEETFNNNYYNQTQSQIIVIQDNNIISSNYVVNYTIWGNIKSSFVSGLDLNSDSLVLDIVFCYIILWFVMFLSWHIIYLLFDKLFHLRRE